MIEVHSIIDDTLEKIRAKIVDKALEAENTLKDFEEKLFEGKCNMESLKRQLKGLEEDELKQLQTTKPSLYDSMMTQFERKDELELL